VVSVVVVLVGMMLAANAHPAAKAKVCDRPCPAVLVAPAAPQVQPCFAGEHQLVRRRDGDRYEVIDVLYVYSHQNIVVLLWFAYVLLCSTLLLTVCDQLMVLKYGSLVRARRV
jgi:beta-lactamase regulating signal transducer with metallopeptidase domain